VRVFRNSLGVVPGEGWLIPLPNSFAELLSLAGDKLSRATNTTLNTTHTGGSGLRTREPLCFTRAFLATGEEFDDVVVLDDMETVLLSEGEPFLGLLAKQNRGDVAAPREGRLAMDRDGSHAPELHPDVARLFPRASGSNDLSPSESVRACAVLAHNHRVVAAGRWDIRSFQLSQLSREFLDFCSEGKPWPNVLRTSPAFLVSPTMNASLKYKIPGNLLDQRLRVYIATPPGKQGEFGDARVIVEHKRKRKISGDLPRTTLGHALTSRHCFCHTLQHPPCRDKEKRCDALRSPHRRWNGPGTM